jgi:hypothetical protein
VTEKIMRHAVFALGLGAAVLASSAALAQQGTVAGAAGGAVAGALVGGPIGAVVGGIGGAVVGTVIAPPPAEVREYVDREAPPPRMRGGEVAVGAPLPARVKVRRVPGYQYGYATLNQRRVIIDLRSRTVVEVLD